MQNEGSHGGAHRAMGGHYAGLGIMALLSFAAMYALMYAMVDRFANVFSNVNQVYMAAMMTAPMLMIELLVMRSMYPSARANAAILTVSAVVVAGCWFGIRRQAAVSDRQFLKSMIPHHAGAILMCRENQFHDPDLDELCRTIVASQQEEIDFMKRKLREQDGSSRTSSR